MPVPELALAPVSKGTGPWYYDPMNQTKQTMTKLTPAQAYALQVKADRRAAAAERRGSAIGADEARVKSLFATVAEPTKTRVKTAKKSNGKKVRWTSAEFDLLIDLYLKHADATNGSDNRDIIAEQFALQFPERSRSAVCLAVMQVKGLDAFYTAEGLKDTSQELIDKLFAIDSVRFPGGVSKEEKVSNALDALLADILKN